MKVRRGVNVFEAARERLRFTFREFPFVYVAFSGGKDSGVMLNLALDVAREEGKLPLHVLCLDLEAQYKRTVDFVHRMFSRDDVSGHWVCLPLHLRNSVSQRQPFWLAWDPSKKDLWVRELPNNKHVVADVKFFPFFRIGMEFEEFVVDYGRWVTQVHGRSACLIGIRSDESLKRYQTIKSTTKKKFEGLGWTTMGTHPLDSTKIYPIYDWRTEDIWTANGKQNYAYNEVYDLMHLAGLSLSSMRLCQPYGDDQRVGLKLFHALEPETWARVVARVEGANFGKRHAQDVALGHLKIELPPGLTWKEYSQLLLNSMPAATAAHYQAKIDTFLCWWQNNGYPEGIPDVGDAKEEAKKKTPSWRRIAKVLIKNDYWCRGLSFSQTKREFEKLHAALGQKK